MNNFNYQLDFEWWISAISVFVLEKNHASPPPHPSPVVDVLVVWTMSPKEECNEGGGGRGKGADFLLIGLLDAWCTPLSQWWVCSLRGIGNRHLLGPFLYISETILNTSPIFLNFSSSIFSFLDILSSSGLPFSYLFLGLSRNDHRLPTADF